MEHNANYNMATHPSGLKPVLIRSAQSGVHFGLLQFEHDAPHGFSVVLKDSRRVHYWEGAASLSQMAMDGISNHSASRIAMQLPEIKIGWVIEIIPLTEEAFNNLTNAPVWKA